MKSQPKDASVGQVFSGFAVKKNTMKRRAIIAGVLVALIAFSYLFLAWSVSGKIPKGTSYGGVEVGGMKPQAAIQKIQQDLDQRLTKSFTVKMGEKTGTINVSEAGLQALVPATIEKETQFTLNPARIWRAFFGGGPSTLNSQVDEAKLSAALDKVSKELKVNPVEANFKCAGDKFEAIEPSEGATLNKEQAQKIIAANWSTAALPVVLPHKTVEPKSTVEQLNKAKDGIAKAITSAPLNVKIGDKTTSLAPSVLCSNARFSLGKDGLEASFDGEKLRQTILEKLPGIEKEPVDAQISFETGSPKIIPSKEGSTLVAEQVATKVYAGAITTNQRDIGIDLQTKAPGLTTKDAENFGIKQKVSEFSTPYTYGLERNYNLVLGAKKISGIILKPGQTFSLQNALGPIDAQYGWQKAMVINNGFHTKALGGGLSQVSTTTFNAAYFAGMDIVEFTPHTQYFTRYPEGRESTLWEGSIDMKFKNSAPTAVAINSFASGGRFTVQIWGTPYWEVKDRSSGRYNVVPPRSVNSMSQHCVPQNAGQPGFSVKFTRERWLNGAKHDEQSWVTNYQAQNKITCGPQPEAPAQEEHAAPAQ